MAQDINKVQSKMINEEEMHSIYKNGLPFFVCQELLEINEKSHLVKWAEFMNKQDKRRMIHTVPKS